HRARGAREQELRGHRRQHDAAPVGGCSRPGAPLPGPAAAGPGCRAAAGAHTNLSACSHAELMRADEAAHMPDLDIVVPVFNEEPALERSVRRLHAFLLAGFPFGWRIANAANAGTTAMTQST